MVLKYLCYFYVIQNRAKGVPMCTRKRHMSLACHHIRASFDCASQSNKTFVELWPICNTSTYQCAMQTKEGQQKQRIYQQHKNWRKCGFLAGALTKEDLLWRRKSSMDAPFAIPITLLSSPMYKDLADVAFS